MLRRVLSATEGSARIWIERQRKSLYSLSVLINCLLHRLKLRARRDRQVQARRKAVTKSAAHPFCNRSPDSTAALYFPDCPNLD